MDLFALMDANADVCGAIVFWRIEGGVPVAAVRAALANAGIPEKALPEPPSNEVVLSRAVKHACGSVAGRRPVSRLLRDGSWSIASAIDTVVPTAAGEQDDGTRFSRRLEFRGVARVRLSAGGRFIGKADDEAGTAFLDVCRALVEDAGDRLDATDVPAWLVRLMTAADATSLRPQGGIYFVPRHAMPIFRAVVDAVHAHTATRITAIPAVRGDDASGAILEGLRHEAEAAFAALLEATSEKGERAQANRQSDIDALVRKIERFESSIGSRADAARAALETANAAAYASSVANARAS